MRHAFLIRDLDPPRGPSSVEVIAMLVASGWVVDPHLPVGFCRDWRGVGKDAVLVFADKEPGEGEQRLSWSAWDLILGNHRMESVGGDPRYADGRAPDEAHCEWTVSLAEGTSSEEALKILDRLMAVGFVPRYETPLHRSLGRRYAHGFFRDDRATLEAVEGVKGALRCKEETG